MLKKNTDSMTVTHKYSYTFSDLKQQHERPQTHVYSPTDHLVFHTKRKNITLYEEFSDKIHYWILQAAIWSQAVK